MDIEIAAQKNTYFSLRYEDQSGTKYYDNFTILRGDNLIYKGIQHIVMRVKSANNPILAFIQMDGCDIKNLLNIINLMGLVKAIVQTDTTLGKVAKML